MNDMTRVIRTMAIVITIGVIVIIMTHSLVVGFVAVLVAVFID